ncbi:2,3-diphosphoglycerate-dependent phosphoglycerate mutase [Pantoea sp. Mhis]|uniref:2,3-diphosphoglycerate-dependent phosphoglycerate mutase n=1 Tax=Pantoea sp. Mhis TaxID=2576759 RepID=UPI00135BF0D8|nr:2,3-diphosphoglycerate-dependent phosphoglycerate mutase [Pantoea sp. Mhis]MXP56297.1 2,3-diphosphoglycerate-dependent phosphoglycerate mutase [Pantoea sp. Mhis]
MHTTKLVLIRHGESEWNKENRFTGWYDVDLSDKGRNEAKIAGKLLKDKFIFNYAYTSLLKRAIHTLWYILDELDLAWLPVEKTWRLNERHYGALQGLNKTETIEKYGDKQVQKWRRGFMDLPPALNSNNQHYSGYDQRYESISNEQLPTTESLALTMNRVIPFWEKNIFPRIKNNEQIIIVAHGNSLRALIKHIDHINEDKISELNIPTGIPIVYFFNKNFVPIKHYYLN